ncbi:hypothetical protein AB0M43_14460 [Longispora sp. NPDC051575]|uniref:hypothetical protein n=1 Tax=Longispora sp. NPDC051575 TaxID=3154943 RepID=UPI003425436C
MTDTGAVDVEPSPEQRRGRARPRIVVLIAILAILLVLATLGIERLINAPIDDRAFQAAREQCRASITRTLARHKIEIGPEAYSDRVIVGTDEDGRDSAYVSGQVTVGPEGQAGNWRNYTCELDKYYDSQNEWGQMGATVHGLK